MIRNLVPIYCQRVVYQRSATALTVFGAKDHVGAYIRAQRLERIRADLANPVMKADSISTISARYGLHDASQVSRAFKAEFRESPSAFRARVLGQ
ncbi:helix-turn-helix domain-containing protein [Corynebacterium ammoniagenes]|uniref:helix-turn-helix domain-containing protein n=1 Tax=Corynebacterium ammoniagenes TaxID=1697 RepID=UPI00209B58CF|nr:helix-turn-helix domain-containing protein [Corynebacterium ammoniagenes]